MPERPAHFSPRKVTNRASVTAMSFSTFFHPSAPTTPPPFPLTSPFELPFDDPILVFALAVTAFLIAPLVLERFRMPGIVGIILVGALVGPNALGLLERGETIVLLGQVGIVYLMFLAGLEIDLGEFTENRGESIGFGFVSFLLPQVVGTLVGHYALGLPWLTAALFASVFASHTLLAYPVASRLGIGDNRAVTTSIGGTILTDTLALLVLAVVAAATVGDLTGAFWLQLVGGLALFFVGVWVLVPRLSQWFFRTVHEESYFEYLFVLAVAFIAAYAAELAGVEAIIGAFLAGLAINPHVPQSGVLMNRVEFVGNALFIPFFLLSVGMLVDFRVVFAGPETLVITGALVAMTLATKLGASAVAGHRYGWSAAEVATSFGLSVGQAAAALAVTLVGFELGLFDDTVVNAVVLMILVISVVAPAVVDRYGRAIAVATEQTAETPNEPERVLVPVSTETDHPEGLLDLAMSVRTRAASEPLYTVTVVHPTSRVDTTNSVAEAESVGDQLTRYAAGAGIDLISRTRIGQNVASAIADAATETRASTIVIGWDGARSRRQNTFGGIIDRVLRLTNQLVAVARVHDPLNTTRRVVLVLPPEIARNRGFYRAVHVIKAVADDLGAPIVAYAVDGDTTGYTELLRTVTPETATEVHDSNGWSGLLDVLGEARSDDFVVCVSSRKGRRGWNEKLQTLPKSISTLADGNFAVVYPPTVDDADERRFLKLR